MQQRNLNFKTKLFDWELTAQYSLFNLNYRWWTPYIFAGIGVFHYKPYTYDSAGNKTYLKPLSTEGEGFMSGVKDYKLMQFSIPMGVGAEYSLNEDIRERRAQYMRAQTRFPSNHVRQPPHIYRPLYLILMFL